MAKGSVPIAHRLASDGAAVAVLDLNGSAADEVAGKIRADGGRAIGVAANVTDRAQVQAAVDRTVAEFGALHILVDNAGVTRDNLLFTCGGRAWSP